VIWHPTSGMPAGAGYFHAGWRRQEVVAVNMNGRNRSGEYNYTVLDARGPGRFVGLNLNVFSRHPTWRGEGDPMIFVDDDAWPPSIHSTGTEDYFNDGWGFHRGAACPVSAALMTGLVNRPWSFFGGNAVFSFHLPDSVPFRRRIRVSFEHGTENDLTNDYSSTAYWYAKAGAEDFFLSRPAAERTAIPPERWSSMRDLVMAKTFAVSRRRLAKAAREIREKATGADTFVVRRSVLLETLRYAPLAVLPEAQIHAIADRFDGSAREGPTAQWKILDLLLLELAARFVGIDAR
jgi:hypothetical protein